MNDCASAAGLVSFELASDPASGQRSILGRFAEKLRVAANAIDSGAAAAKLEEWIAASR